MPGSRAKLLRRSARRGRCDAMTQPAAQGTPARKLRVAFIGIGWWSDVLADAAQRSGAFEIASCYTRSEGKCNAFAAKYACRAAATYEEVLGDRSIEAIVNTTPNA